MYHKEEIARLRAIPHTISCTLMNLLIQDMISIIRELSPSGHLDLEQYHGPQGICYPALVNIEQNPDEEKNLQAPDTLDIAKDDKKILIDTREGKYDTDLMTQAELLDLYDELDQILEDRNEPDWEFVIDEIGIIKEKAIA